MNPENINCPECDRVWPINCEQSRAVQLRGMCIACLVQTGEHFEMDPYEFREDNPDLGELNA